ncbi:hypothetical protein K432DRAFT_428517 [Lepidopterella palustris CBS 459.81]|uniref:STB6-like N-terminal domain-containing protein n=1 Tax=Lepidopterella palustris CBS 459.81 TaxID=1314670 RepID=A0A8E2JBV8_9PEZI|nr:hypothetical protein K432DRAFT_428517 [Lepidopterella palustris CBS 459.81]
MSHLTRSNTSDPSSSRNIPPIRTAFSDMKNDVTATEDTSGTSLSWTGSLNDSAKISPTRGTHQRFVLTDPVAFKYLEEEPSTTVLARRQRLEGYEIYLVEQWACSRTHPTFIITTYAGDPSSSVVANVLSVPRDEAAWSPQLRVYFKALNQYHARKRETSLGTLMITNLSGFPSSLTVIPVPDGDVTKHRELFFVNENLKRLGCSGRLGITLSPPSSATIAKFHQLYRTSDKIPLNSSVIELVKLCQVALVLFGNLEPEYADGLLCDYTEKAINDWWIEFGTEYYSVEPHDGILGPTTVAALLGMLMGARNRLSAYNAPVAKDVFDIDSTKRGIAYFQKTQRMQKTRRLDRQTLERLRRATAKAASGEGWTVPRAVKSTVAELSGKGGEMVMGMVGRGRAGIAEVETVDIERFVELVHGERPKWLWYGKPRKSTSGDMFSRLPGDESLVFQKDDQGGYAWSRQRRESMLDDSSLRKRETGADDGRRPSDGQAALDGFERDTFSKRAALKKATGKIEARSGFGRIKEAVGRRSHQPKTPRDENGYISPYQMKNNNVSALQYVVPGLARSSTTLQKAEDKISGSENGSAANSAVSPHPGSAPQPTFTKTLTHTPHDSRGTFFPDEKPIPQTHEPHEPSTLLRSDADESSKPPTVDGSIAGSIYRGIDLTNILPLDDGQDVGPLLRRTQSLEQLSTYHAETRNDNWWPRHLSFSIAEENILTWSAPDGDYAQLESTASPKRELRKQLLLADDAKRIREQIALLESLDGAWVEDRITSIQDLDEQTYQDTQELDGMYYQRLEGYQALREDTHEILSQERSQLQDAVKDIETLGAKLEYEINTLRSKVDDVDDGIAEFERQVEIVEDRVKELEEVFREKEGWGHWMLRMMTGLGKPPLPAAAASGQIEES